MRAETFFSASEALALNFIHEAINAKTNRERMLAAAMQASASIQYDLCAMIAKLESLEDEPRAMAEITTLKDVENSLREHGYSRKEATAFVSQLKAILLKDAREEQAEHEQARSKEVAQAKILQDFANSLKNL